MKNLTGVKRYLATSSAVGILIAGVMLPANPAAAFTCTASDPSSLNSCWNVGGQISLTGDIYPTSRLPTPGGSGVTLNLNGYTLKPTGGITVSSSRYLTINGPGLVVASATASNYAGIGGDPSTFGSGGAITINGADVVASGGDNAAGIGAGHTGDTTVTVTGGTVTSVGGDNGAGIGSASSQSQSSKVKIAITGGVVAAYGGQKSAGIGTGPTNFSETNTTTISGGSVTAIGGTYGAGIGGGFNSVVGAISITGGTVQATGGRYGAGIGSAVVTSAKPEAHINIAGGKIVAKGGIESAGIGGGQGGSGAAVSVTGGDIQAIGGSTASDIKKTGVGIGSGIKNPSLSVAPGTLTLVGSKNPGTTLANGGQGTSGKTAVTPVIAYSSKPNFAFLVTPVSSGVPNGAGSIWIRRGVLPQHPKAGAWPKSVKKKGTTLLNVANAKTQEGLPLSAKVSISKKYNKSKCLKWYRKSNRYLAVKTTGKCSLTFKVTYTAPKSTWNSAYKATKSYKVKR